MSKTEDLSEHINDGYTCKGEFITLGGGILDGEIWKTIHLGVDSYTNVLNGTNLFYHGRVAFNFNDSK